MKNISEYIPNPTIGMGENCYIVASGASFDHFRPSFWEGKFILGLNSMAKHLKCNMTIAKDIPTRYGDEVIVVSRHKFGAVSMPENTVGDYYFNHPDNLLKVVNFPKNYDIHQIVVSLSTITSAMHLAAYLGFHNIFLCGADGGAIDGQINCDGYYPDGFVMPFDYEHYILQIEPQSMLVRDWLEKRYGVNICSLTPFVSMRLEGHKFA